MNMTFETLQCIPSNHERELQLTDVFIAQIEKKSAATVIAELNTVHPIPLLRHLRRIRSVVRDGGNILEIILCLADEAVQQNQQLSLPVAVAELVKKHELIPTKTPVPMNNPPTKERWLKWKEHWPMPWRLTRPELSEDTTADFQMRAEGQMQSIFRLLDGSASINAAIIVDPATDRVIAEALDKSEDYPLRHAVMEVIRIAAEDDVQSDHSPKRPRLESDVVDGQYLCTGYEMYVLLEPCLMCAMAMVHSRFNRAVFSRADAEGGAFTVHGLHRNKRLNHRYAVYQLREKTKD